ncbi:MAG: TonB family protein [Acidobacteria bacterium]|nr:TonB family protein [Acidobacteriota bacterium]
MIAVSATEGLAQTPQLSLADLMIGLRSQKVPLEDRNRILAAAVAERGITFVYTEQIATELKATGASPELIEAIRAKSEEQLKPKPVPTPTPPDYTFYQRRAIENSAKGEYVVALADFDKAAEMKTDDPTIFIGRGRTHFNLKNFDRSVSDFNRVIELSPSDSSAYFNRASAFERLGDLPKAILDFSKALELDPENSAARAGLARSVAALASNKPEEPKQAAQPVEAAEEPKKAEPVAEAKPQPEQAQPPVEEPVQRPEFINVGVLSNANSIRMSMPIYSQIARRSNIEGRVVVEVEIDENGEVISAKAVSGHQMLRDSAEDAARKSRFRPFEFDGTPIKAKGSINYNFSLKGSE